MAEETVCTESIIFRAVATIDNRNDEAGKVIKELEEKLTSILSVPPPIAETACDKKEATACQLEERLRQAGDEIIAHIDHLRNIISRLQL